jgi:hypothetical protein
MTSPFQAPEQHDDQDQDWQQVDQVIADRKRQLTLSENDKSDDDCLARFARALHTAIKKGRGAHTFSCGRRCPAGADEGMRCAPWPANCPHPAVPARPRKRGSPRSPREKERRPRRVCNSTVKRARARNDREAWAISKLRTRFPVARTSPTPERPTKRASGRVGRRVARPYRWIENPLRARARWVPSRTTGSARG